jgi:hypothetical protein
VVPEPKIIFPDPPYPRTPEEEMQRTDRILRTVFWMPKQQTELTVGDLSIVTERKRQKDLEWSQKPVNCASDVTIGDLSITQKDNRGLDELYEGPKASDIKSYVSESQRLQWELIKIGERNNKKFKG